MDEKQARLMMRLCMLHGTLDPRDAQDIRRIDVFQEVAVQGGWNRSEIKRLMMSYLYGGEIYEPQIFWIALEMTVHEFERLNIERSRAELGDERADRLYKIAGISKEG